MTTEFQFDVFLSHNLADRPRVHKLAEKLKQASLRVWFDEWIIKPGDDIYLAIERGLETSRTLVLCLSSAALGSDWVSLERNTVLFRDPANTGRRFIPVLLSDCILPDTLRRYKYVDYRDDGQAAFNQLLAGCRPQEQLKRVADALVPPTKPRSAANRENEEQWQRADKEVQNNLPPGVRLVRTLRGHTNWIGRIAWSPDGTMLATPSGDKTIRLWDIHTGECIRVFKGHDRSVNVVAFAPSSKELASASADNTIRVWNIHGGKPFYRLETTGWVDGVAFYDNGTKLMTADGDGKVIRWNLATGQYSVWLENQQAIGNTVTINPSGEIVASVDPRGLVTLYNIAFRKPNCRLLGHRSDVNGISFDRSGDKIATSGYDRTVKIWDTATGQLRHSLEGHSALVNCVAFSGDGRLVVSKSKDDTLRIWRTDNGVCVANIWEPAAGAMYWPPGIAFHPRLPLLAVVGSDPSLSKDDCDQVVHLYELDFAVLVQQEAEPSAHYVNAKVLLVGDTGVGKSGLSLVLRDLPFEATDSTPDRRAWIFDSREVDIGNKVTQTRETLLWDLAGQPGYRIIHQLHLNEVTVALVVFDARSETDPLAGVRHWERALRLAQQRQGPAALPMKKFLVSARNDRGGVPIGDDRLKAILKEFDFDHYFKTSAKTGSGIKQLRAAIEEAIEWEKLPMVSSSQLFAEIKSFLLKAKETGTLLAPASQLYGEFAREYSDRADKVENLRDQFDTCIGRLENRDLIRQLTFGGYVLLQPELLDAYGSSMVNTAKEEPDGLGSLAEEIALSGKFFVPDERKVKNSGQEQLLLHATVEELVRHDLALRENADDGRYLVFPSQFNRDYEDAPEPKGKAVAITFDGPVQSLYSTLAVRLGHSGLFTTGRAEMWRNAAVFTAKAGGKCGLFVNEFSEGRGRLILFFDEHASQETRFHFEEFVLAHSKKRALDNSVEQVRFFACPDCGEPVPDAYVKTLLVKGKKVFGCPCGGSVSLAEPKERIQFPSKVEAMDKSADRQRDFDAFVMSAKGETSTKSFQDWAGGAQVTLAIVFTDVVGSTALGEEIRDEAMNDVRRAHFARSRGLIEQFQGREIKTIGDSFMTAFRNACAALDYARALQANTGHPQVRIRAGVHIGPLHVEEGDVFGGTVNFAARVVGAIKQAEIWLSDRAKEDIDRLGSAKHKALKWHKHEGVAMKGFRGNFALWSLAQ